MDLHCVCRHISHLATMKIYLGAVFQMLQRTLLALSTLPEQSLSCGGKLRGFVEQ